VLVGVSNEGLNGGTELIFVGETGSAHCLAGQEPEPDFHLIEPSGRSRSEVELHAALVFFQPVRVALVRRVVVKNHMDLFVARQFGNDCVQEAAEVRPFFLLRSLSENLSTGDFQNRK
jgi:hypothetical protein